MRRMIKWAFDGDTVVRHSEKKVNEWITVSFAEVPSRQNQRVFAMNMHAYISQIGNSDVFGKPRSFQ